MVKNLPIMQETWVQFLGWEDPLEKGMATHSSILVWIIPWTEKPGRLQSMGVTKSWTQLSDLITRTMINYIRGFPGSSVIKNLPANVGASGAAGAASFIPESGRPPGRGNGNPLQYSW